MLNIKWTWWLLLIALVVFDQGSKHLSVAYLLEGEPFAIIPGLNFTLAYNKGAAFSFLADSAGWQRWFFVGITVLVSVLLLYWLSKTKIKLEQFAFILILSGAIGNLIDRLAFGHVIDFIDVYFKNWHWYTFNIADSAICVGAFLVLWVSFFKKDNA